MVRLFPTGKLRNRARLPEDLKTNFALEQRSYQGSLYRDLTDHLQGGVYADLAHGSGDTPIGELSTPDHRLGNGFPVFFPTQRSCRMAFLLYDTRNDAGLTRGINIYGRAASDDGLNNNAAFTDYG